MGHSLIVEEAIDSLPKPLKQFYEDREVALTQMVSDPAMVAPRLVFEVDRLESFPFNGLPQTRALAERKYGKDQLAEVGDAPWRLAEAYESLVGAFRDGKWEEVSKLSAEIAYVIGEMYVPMNISKWGDGEQTNQDGLRERFDSRLLDVYSGKLKVDAPDAIYLDRPAGYALSIPLKSFVWVDNLLLMDYMSRKGVESYDRFYYEGMWIRGADVVRTLFRGATMDTASFWYSAWVDARKPELPKR